MCRRTTRLACRAPTPAELEGLSTWRLCIDPTWYPTSAYNELMLLGPTYLPADWAADAQSSEFGGFNVVALLHQSNWYPTSISIQMMHTNITYTVS